MNIEEKSDAELKNKDEGGDISNKLKIIDEDDMVKKGNHEKHKSMKRPEKDKKLETDDKEDEDEYKKSEQVLSNMIIISPYPGTNTILKNYAKKTGRQVSVVVQEIVEEWALKQKKGKSRGMTDIQRLDDIDEKLNSMEIAARGNISQMRRRVRELKERNKEKE